MTTLLAKASDIVGRSDATLLILAGVLALVVLIAAGGFVLSRINDRFNNPRF